MEKKGKTIIKLVFILLSLSLGQYSYAQSDTSSRKFIYYPETYAKWNYRFVAGASISSFPAVISENQVSHSPMLFGGFRIGMPLNISASINLSSNYISNYASISLICSPIQEPITIAIGGKIAGWYGQLELDAENFNSRGFILNPLINLGIRLDKLMLSIELESQYSRFFTYSENEFLGTVKEPEAGYGISINLEQPLWNDNYVVIGLKINYSKFFYQSWLSYNTIDEFLFYPEVLFGFIL